MIPYGLPKNDTSGFYKLNPDNTLLLQREVLELNLTKENHEQYQYPVQNWYWFDGEADARGYFNLPDAEIIPNGFDAYSEIDPLILQPQNRPIYGGD